MDHAPLGASATELTLLRETGDYLFRATSGEVRQGR
jgi:hypothetical protein